MLFLYGQRQVFHRHEACKAPVGVAQPSPAARIAKLPADD